MKEKFLEILRRKLEKRGFRVKRAYTFLLKREEWQEEEIYLIYLIDQRGKEIYVFFGEYFTKKVERKLYRDLKRIFSKKAERRSIEK